MNEENLIHHLQKRASECPTQIAIQYKDRGRWQYYRWQDIQKIVAGLSKSLKEHGVSKGDRVAVMANTRPEWFLTDLAIMAAGAVTVPIYPSLLPEDIGHVLNDSEAQMLILENSAQWARWLEAKDGTNNAPEIVVLDTDGMSQSEDWKSWSSLLDSGRDSIEDVDQYLKAQADEIQLSDLATLPYTSGTTGKPKGVMLTHRQIMSELIDVFKIIPVTGEDLTLTFLPFSHIFGRVESWGSIYAGYRLGFAESIDKIRSNLQEIKPTFMLAVPRIFEKLHAAILTQVETKPLTKKIFDIALSVGRRYSQYIQEGKPVPFTLLAEYKAADRLVFKKIREKLGGRLRFAVSGGAPLNAEVSEFFHAVGILVLEGYGLTETTAGICFNSPIKYKLGTVGPALEDVEIKVAPDGELLIKSDKVMTGYYNNQEATDEVFEDGYFKTGDIGEVDANGFVKITDRKKDLIKTAGGKYVAPQKLEGMLKLDPLVSNVLIHGDQRKYVVALVTLDPVQAKAYAKKEGIDFENYSDLVEAPEIKNKIKGSIADANSTLASFESIKKFQILPNDFTIESGELTPSLKVKRKHCDTKYKNLLDSLYSGS